MGMNVLRAPLSLLLIVPLLFAPLAALTWLAARSVDQQETYMRARLRESLFLEVSQTNARIREWFEELPDTLGFDAPGSGTVERPAGSELAAWKDRNPLVGMPFILDAQGSIVYPDAKRTDVSDEETRLFYWRYLNVFGNQERIPVYRNIALEYESSIVNVQPPDSGGYPERVSAAGELAPQERMVQRTSRIEPGSELPPVPKKNVRAKVAQSIFESDVEVQRQVYELAADEGKETLTRNVAPTIDPVAAGESIAPRSLFIESDRYFKDLVAQAERGLVPRIFDNSFVLLYWEKRGDWIVGCELDMEAVREAIVGIAGAPADGIRYLAVLDHSGLPLVSSGTLEPSVWRTPLVSGEISEYLPYWETAVILSDSSAFESRVRSSRYALTVLVLSLALSVFGGVFILWRYSSIRLLEAKRRTGFVTTVSHELKTPLTSIRMYSEMLAGGADLDRKKRSRYLACIVGESERLTRLINDVLDVAKLERGNHPLDLVPLDLTATARDVFEGFADRLQTAGFSVFFQAPEISVVVCADREAVVRILFNLISNAEKYSPEVKEIIVSVSYHGDGGEGRVSVSDRGIGVPRAHREKIFRQFHRVDDSLTSEQGGTGLGLSIARSLARAMHGEVRYSSRDSADGEKGSLFTLSLPLLVEKDHAE